jgi:hypothetical protein
MKLSGCIDKRLNGMLVEHLGPLSVKDREKRFMKSERHYDWVWVITKFGKTWAKKERIYG